MTNNGDNGDLELYDRNGHELRLNGDRSVVCYSSYDPLVYTISLDGRTGTVTSKVVEITGGDLAEPFAIAGEKPCPGTLVVIDPERAGLLTVSSHAYDPGVAGVVSGAGGISTGIRMYRA